MRRHGSVGTYRIGCRCQACTDANRHAQRRNRERKRYQLARIRDGYAPITRRGPYASSLPGIDQPVPHFPHAACRRPDLNLDWFAGERVAREAAKTICRNCPEQHPCAAWAIEHPQEIGIWGGLTEDERDRIRQRREVG